MVAAQGDHVYALQNVGCVGDAQCVIAFQLKHSNLWVHPPAFF